MNLNSKIFVAGHNGMVGSSIVRKLKNYGYTNIVTRTSNELNLMDQQSTENFFKENNIEYVFLAAAKVGGILANNTKRAEFIYNPSGKPLNKMPEFSFSNTSGNAISKTN